MNYSEKYNYWKQKVTDKELLDELNNMNDSEIEDAFYRDLAFGTGGLRGILGVGTNRMNIYVVAKASQGLANYINKHYTNPSIAIGYDTRIKSDVFSCVAAEVFSQNGIKVYIYNEPLPVPTLSYATRALHCSAGVMITASHNPSKYNGYKVYGDDGCQITTQVAKDILEEINKIDEFEVIRKPFENNELIEFIDSSILDSYIEEVKNQSFLYGDDINKDINVVYTPLNGTGYKPVTRVLKELGYNNIITVKEQESPDGNFPTCPYPNPEIKEALTLGIKYAKDNNADILIATDPDSDRVGVAIKDNDDFTILSGNDVGVLLFNYICEQKFKHNKMPNNPVLIKTIVTTDLADKIADKYNIETINVLTGYKFIGEQIGILEKNNRVEDFIFSFEESDGYLSGTYVRDKDGVNGACLVCEMYAYYKTRNISLKEKLEEIYKEFGYYTTSLESYEFPGSDGFNKMQSIMKSLRDKPLQEIAGNKVIKQLDYLQGIDNLPKSDVIKYYFENGSLVIRPSGTEPKLKAYILSFDSEIEKSKEINNTT
ncbi:MAG: phospho-sugar mutase, partial [Firmicutes bacterium]|nr:phospho-sugar mutase [Candidatus Colivicinus equi]